MADVLQLNAEDAKNLAISKTLGVCAGVVSIMGAIYALRANPKFRETTDAAWKSLPAPLQQNKAFTLLLGGGLAAYFLSRLIASRTK